MEDSLPSLSPSPTPDSRTNTPQSHSLATPTPLSSTEAFPPTTLRAPSLPPKISETTNPTASYISRFAEISARAAHAEPFTLLLQQEWYSLPLSSITHTHLYDSNILRLQRKTSMGAILVEAGDFAAVACWEPPFTTSLEYEADTWGDVDIVSSMPDGGRRPIYVNFRRQIAEGMRKVFPKCQKYWHVSLMARDPERTEKGVVRAVIEPFVARAKEEGVPLWLEAGSERARDVYQWVGGFRVVGVVVSGRGEFDKAGRRVEGGNGQGVTVWLMVANWPVEKR